MTELKITKTGTMKVRKSWSDADEYEVYPNFKCSIGEPAEIMTVRGHDENPRKAKSEAKANAFLAAEAINVANETGLTPRQLLEQVETCTEENQILLEQRDDLLLTLRKVREDIKHMYYEERLSPEFWFDHISEAISKAESGNV